MTVKKKATRKKATKKKTTTKKNLKRGRPTKYKPEFCEYLLDHLSGGGDYTTFGAVLPKYDPELDYVSESVLYDWEKAHPEFLAAKKKGWKNSEEFWLKEGQKGMWAGKAFNPSVWVFMMKNKFGWSDRREVKHDATEELKHSFGFKLDQNPDDLE